MKSCLMNAHPVWWRYILFGEGASSLMKTYPVWQRHIQSDESCLMKAHPVWWNPVWWRHILFDEGTSCLMKAHPVWWRHIIKKLFCWNLMLLCKILFQGDLDSSQWKWNELVLFLVLTRYTVISIKSWLNTNLKPLSQLWAELCPPCF